MQYPDWGSAINMQWPITERRMNFPLCRQDPKYLQKLMTEADHYQTGDVHNSVSWQSLSMVWTCPPYASCKPEYY